MRSGFSIVRNGESLGYPWQESLRSLAPLVDEIVVAHGDSTDGTGAALARLAAELPCPLRVIESPWDPRGTRGGLELSRQTNVALAACRHEVGLYLQSDEVLHEDDYEILRRDLARFESDDEVDALALTWEHFYGTFGTVVRSRQWYRREIRVVKRSRGLRSYGDAQGFRIPVDSTGVAVEPEAAVRWEKPRAALSSARCLHYGWVRPPEVMAKKSETLDRLWHGNARDGQHKAENAYPPVFGMRPFPGEHPAVMRERVKAFHENFPGFDPFRGKSLTMNAKTARLWLTDLVEQTTGWRPGEFKNYRSLKSYE